MTAAALPAPRTPAAPPMLMLAGALVAGLYLLVATVGRWMPVDLAGPVQTTVASMRLLPPLATPSLDGVASEGLAATFARYNYRLDPLLDGDATVPRLVVTRLPGDLDALEVEPRKRLFLRAVLPLVLSANDAILEHRRRLRELAAQRDGGAPLPEVEVAWLERLAAHYRLDEPDIDELLLRVDMVPPSLALAQAATESGWGTSRFAREGNALFGQWTWSEDGLRPREAPPDATHRVRRFESLQGAVRAYMRNLNTHPAYAEFRDRRAGMRAAGAAPDGAALATTLHAYSERGEEYIDDLLTIIRVNGLRALDRARLAPIESLAEAPPA